MNRAHEAEFDAKCVIQHFHQRREAVGGAARVRNDVVFHRVVNVVIDAEANRRVWFLRRCADQDFARSALADVELGFVATGEKSSRLQDDVDAEIFPGQIGGIAFF